MKVEEEKTKQKESTKEIRAIKRKPDIPKANVKNFEEENSRMGITNELDLLMGESPEK